MALLTLTWWVSFLFELLVLVFNYIFSQAVTEESSTDQLPNDNTIYALVIGINTYAYSEDWPDLQAAVADADAIEAVLVNQLKVLRQNIINLRDGQATRQEYQPAGENLLAQEPAHVSVPDVDDVDADASVLGMTLYNDGPEPVYPYLFYFDPNDLTITPWVMPAVGAALGLVDPPLLAGSKLTLGYGNGGATPWEFVFTDDRPKDVGFFKLFLSSSPANFACLTRRKTPFERDPAGHRLGAELDKEVKEATALEKRLDSSTERWGVKLATVIQIRK
ncbi:hypothetical protein H1R20_g2521, partial [Candolleomyces eurysporus]